MGRLDPSAYRLLRMTTINTIKSSKYQWINLKDVVEFRKEIVSDSSELPYVGLENIKSNIGFYVPSTEEKESFNSALKFEVGDVLFPKLRPYLNKVHLAQFNGVCSTEFYVLKGKDLNNLYLFTFLSSKFVVNQTTCLMTGNTLPRLQTQDVQKLPILLPPPEIQNDIAKIMQSAYTAKKQKGQEANDLLNSIDDYVLTELGIKMLLVEEKKCFVVYAGETTSLRIDPFYYKNHYKVIENLLSDSSNVRRLAELLQLINSGSRPKGGVGNIQSGVLSFGGEHINDQCEVEIKTPRYIPHKFHSLHKGTETQLNDILLVKDGATTGKIGIVSDTAHIGQNINEHLFLLRTKDDVNPIYLLNYLNSSFGKLQIQREITGATVTGITRDVVKRLKIILPDIAKQTEIADHISEIRSNVKRLQQEANDIVEEAKKRIEQILLAEA